MPNRVAFTIADLKFVLRWRPEFGVVNLPRAFLPFRSPAHRSVSGDMRLELSAESLPEEKTNPIFDVSPIWSLHRMEGGLSFQLFESYPELRRRIFLPASDSAARFTFLGQNRDPFVGPGVELLTITRLAPGEGVILHGCGVSAGGRGIVFAGESGAGKSTLSRLWAQEPGIEILSDDRVIVCRRNGAFLLYGTPWHGDEAFAAPGGVELSRIFFIRHGPHNQIRRLAAGSAVAAMLKCSFPPLWDAGGTAAVLALLHALAAGVPCAGLAFVPDSSVIEVVRHFLRL